MWCRVSLLVIKWWDRLYFERLNFDSHLLRIFTDIESSVLLVKRCKCVLVLSLYDFKHAVGVLLRTNAYCDTDLRCKGHIDSHVNEDVTITGEGVQN
jgi:hypothetical protein